MVGPSPPSHLPSLKKGASLQRKTVHIRVQLPWYVVISQITLLPVLLGSFVRTYQNNNSSNYCYYYYYNDSNEARSQRLHGKLWCYFINIVDHCLLKTQLFIINADVQYVIMKDGVTFYLRTDRKKDLLVHIVIGIHLHTAIIHLALASTQ